MRAAPHLLRGLVHNGRMKVLYASFDVVPAPKGASTHIARFVEALVAQYGDVDLMTLGPSPSRPESRFYGARHLRICPPSTHYLDQALHFRWAVDEQLRAEPYDIVHFRCIWAGVPAIAAARRLGFRTVFEANGFPSIELPYHYPGLARRPDLLGRLAEQEAECLGRADTVVVPSDVTRLYAVSRGAPEARVVTIRNGVDPELFRPVRRDVEPGGRVRLLYVGTLAPWQGVSLLVDAVARACRQVDIELTLLAPHKGQWARPLLKRIAKLGLAERVQLVPPRALADVPAAVAAADVCLAPLANTRRNRVQGCCPIKVLEYLACGRAVVAAGLPVVREMLTHGETGWLYRAGDARSLRNAILTLAGDPALRARLGAAGRDMVCQRFTWRAAQARLIELYEGLR